MIDLNPDQAANLAARRTPVVVNDPRDPLEAARDWRDAHERRLTDLLEARRATAPHDHRSARQRLDQEIRIRDGEILTDLSAQLRYSAGVPVTGRPGWQAISRGPVLSGRPIVVRHLPGHHRHWLVLDRHGSRVRAIAHTHRAAMLFADRIAAIVREDLARFDG